MNRLSRFSFIAVALLGLSWGSTEILAGTSKALAQQEPRTVIAVPTAPVDYRPSANKVSAGFLDIYANGELCGRLSFSDPVTGAEDGGREFVIGERGQPASCSTEGATLTFQNGNGTPLLQTLTLKLGTRIEITNFAPPPISDPGPAGGPLRPADIPAGLAGAIRAWFLAHVEDSYEGDCSQVAEGRFNARWCSGVLELSESSATVSVTHQNEGFSLEPLRFAKQSDGSWRLSPAPPSTGSGAERANPDRAWLWTLGGSVALALALAAAETSRRAQASRKRV